LRGCPGSSTRHIMKNDPDPDSECGTHLVHIVRATNNGHPLKVAVSLDFIGLFLERKTGFEPATFSLTIRKRCLCSAPVYFLIVL